MQSFLAVLAAALAVTPTIALLAHSTGPSESYSDPCPFGYGDGCEGGGPIDAATKETVAGILEGILKNLNNKKSLVQGNQVVAKGLAVAAEPIDPATKEKVAAILEGILKNLSNKKALVQGKQEVSKGKASTNGCPFGYGEGCGGGGPIDAASKAKVAAILEGILKNLSNKKALVQGRQQVNKAKVAAEACPFGYGEGCGGGGTLDPATKAKVAGILEGILKNLDNKKSLVQGKKEVTKGQVVSVEPIDAATKEKVAAILEGVLKNLSNKKALVQGKQQVNKGRAALTNCPFGYGEGCGGGGTLDSATKAKVAGILEGILKNLSNKKALVQGKQQVNKGTAATEDCPFGYGEGCGSGGPIDSATKEKVSAILEGILKNLSNQKSLVQGKQEVTKGSAEAANCPFGYGEGCGGGGTLDAATKEKVAGILQGILKNLGNKKL